MEKNGLKVKLLNFITGITLLSFLLHTEKPMTVNSKQNKKPRTAKARPGARAVNNLTPADGGPAKASSAAGSFSCLGLTVSSSTPFERKWYVTCCASPLPKQTPLCEVEWGQKSHSACCVKGNCLQGRVEALKMKEELEEDYRGADGVHGVLED